ncbi:Myb-related protein MYBAS1 [Apostasia shenzhenica]|uniref:Myb-related protein MYBAS1 n=1 Tax=Apostasia shenzhenica TaxID=1088818 RepID=A0A2I0B5V0_9ASPA|nr:Myb-related protein MYBAS1 [Apostasia shenzhenica]
MAGEDQSTIKKGPWTEAEDMQLACYVELFGDRRWDFIAKVSGLKRTGKSCRLRWVNYLQPGLKHGRMAPEEEETILNLHSLWGNRWSRIARNLPGRTDNEIKNYWRTRMRKKAQEWRKTSSSSSPSSLNMTDVGIEDNMPNIIFVAEVEEEEEADMDYSLDQIWNEVGELETPSINFEGSYKKEFNKSRISIRTSSM